ncbi:MAG: FAD-dependent oxidoreductase [Kouleothrix sp.]|nr:FAD-dependent oxidoreductase [Kouleothrix sp.]
MADVIVVGGGPAGCAAALRLAQRDLSVILLERQDVGSLSRDRLRSGEGLIPRALRELADLGVAAHDAPWALSRIRRVRTVGPDGAAATDAVGQLGGIVQIDRALFEDDLRRAAARAGVDVRLGWRARRLDYAPGQPIGGVVVQPPGARATSVLRAPIVIDASGRGALSFRTFDVQRSAGDFGTVVMFFDQVAGLDPDVWEAHLFGARQLSVVQLSQIEPGVVRCGLGVSSALQLGARHAHDLFWSQIAQHPALAGRLRGSRIVSRPYVRAGIGYRVRQVTFDGLLLVGDAAGYVNPLFGDGILRALRSARQAAAAAAAALRQDDCTRAGLRIYERQHAARDRVDAVLLGALRGMVRRPGLLLKIASLEWVRHALFSALLRA